MFTIKVLVTTISSSGVHTVVIDFATLKLAKDAVEIINKFASKTAILLFKE